MRRILAATAFVLSVAGAIAPARAAEPFRDCPDCPLMMDVPTGSFLMGSPESEVGRYVSEGPQHRVTIAAGLSVGKFEVTFAEWDACVDAGGCGGYRPGDEGWGRAMQPVIHVDWRDAQAYVSWLSAKTGKRYRLLTEAEWEYAARAGTTTVYPWGEQATHRDGNYYYDKYGSKDAGPDDKWPNAAPVGQFPANAFGLHDMHGNVSEWIEDCWNSNYVGAPSDGAAWLSGDCAQRMTRSSTLGLRSAGRGSREPATRFNFLGFRVARSL